MKELKRPKLKRFGGLGLKGSKILLGGTIRGLPGLGVMGGTFQILDSMGVGPEKAIMAGGALGASASFAAIASTKVAARVLPVSVAVMSVGAGSQKFNSTQADGESKIRSLSEGTFAAVNELTLGLATPARKLPKKIFDFINHNGKNNRLITDHEEKVAFEEKGKRVAKRRRKNRRGRILRSTGKIKKQIIVHGKFGTYRQTRLMNK